MYNKFKKMNRSGFTMAEVLIVVSMIGIISLTLYSGFSNGLKVWKRSQQLVTEEDITISFDKMNSDLRNMFDFSKIEFEGRRHQIIFPTIVHVPVDPRIRGKQGEYTKQIGRVRYFVNSKNKHLIRQKANYGQALKGRFFPGEVLAQQVTDIDFTYYVVDQFGDLKRTISTNDRPSAVRVTIEYLNTQEKKQTISKMFFIPVENVEEDEKSSLI